MAIPIPNTVNSINIKELTEKTLDGNGIFDVLMCAVKKHIHEEYKANRIRGTDYANVYLQALTEVLGQATQYSIAKAKLPLELQLLEAEITKIATDTAVATKQGALIEEQANQVQAETARILIETRDKLPAEIAHMKAQTAIAKKELELKEKQLPLLDKELELKAQQLVLGEKEIDLKTQQVELSKKEIAIKEKQIPLMEKELDLKSAQVDVAKKELGIKEKQLEMASYELQYKLPADVALVNAQKDLYNQKVSTEKAQVDGDDVKPNGVIHYQNEVLKQQAQAYVHDSHQKMAKLMLDTWNVRRNSDPDVTGANADNKLTDDKIGTVLSASANQLGITL